jgi:sugar phosphate isomerase/epimerase
MAGAADRRRFIKSTGALAALAVLRPRLAAGGEPRLAVAYSTLPAGPARERFRLAADAGFSGVELETVEDRRAAEELREAADQAGLRIHAVMNSAPRWCRISSRDPDLVSQAVAGIETSLLNAKLWDADAVVIAPAAAGPGISYGDAWRRSQSVISERVIPIARDVNVVLAIEEVWDGFLVGPSEVVRYVDAFASLWVKACFNTSHSVFYAQPRDWVQRLSSRLSMVRTQSRDVREVRRAFAKVDFGGWITVEMANDFRTRTSRRTGRHVDRAPS